MNRWSRTLGLVGSAVLTMSSAAAVGLAGTQSPATTLVLPKRASGGAPPAGTLGALPFDVDARFAMQVAPDGSIREVSVLSVKPLDGTIRTPVPPATASKATDAGLATLRQWRYETSPSGARFRVTFTFRATPLSNSAPRRITGIEACVAAVPAGGSTVAPFSARFGPDNTLGDVTILGGPEHFRPAARALVEQWRFEGAMPGAAMTSVLRFLPADCSGDR